MNPYLLINIEQTYRPEAMSKLSQKSGIICAVEAIKITVEAVKRIIPTWEVFAISNNKLTTEQKEAPKKIIEAVEKWLEGKSIGFQYYDAAYDAAEYVANTNIAAATAARAAASIIYTANIIDVIENDNPHTNPYTIARAISNSADTINSMDRLAGSNSQFYNNWWGKCYPLIQHELQAKYDLLCRKISGEL